MQDLSFDSAKQFWFQIQPSFLSQAAVSEHSVSPSQQWSDIQEVQTPLEEGLFLRDGFGHDGDLILVPLLQPLSFAPLCLLLVLWFPWMPVLAWSLKGGRTHLKCWKVYWFYVVPFFSDFQG